ncbi:TIM barrel protein [Streptacidiphilus monticola]
MNVLPSASVSPSASPAVRNPVGAHVPVAAKGLVGTGLACAAQLHAEAVQVFVANPRGWATPAGQPAQDEAFRAACAALRIPAYVHAPYLINFGTENPLTLERSVNSSGTRSAAAAPSARSGSSCTPARPPGAGRGRRRCARCASTCSRSWTRRTAPGCCSNPPPVRGVLCSRIEELAAYADALDRHPRVGVCLDTCHAFAAGHDLAAEGGVTEALDLLERTLGPGRLRLIHANDSKDVCGARKDRHENIGHGHIGAPPSRSCSGTRPPRASRSSWRP